MGNRVHKRRRRSRSPESEMPSSRRSSSSKGWSLNSSSSTEVDSKIQYDKICVVLRTKGSDSSYSIFMIDINRASNIDSSPYQTLDPILRLDSRWRYSEMAFSLLGSELYMFGGRDCDTYHWTKQMFMVDLKQSCLELGDLVEGREMAGRKFCPIARVVGETSICVFSRILANGRSKDKPSGRWISEDEHRYTRPHFELFNTKKNCWIAVPEPFRASSEAKDVMIESYYFQKSRLCISTGDGGVYSIDFAEPELKWVSVDVAGFPFSDRGLRIDKLLYTRFRIYKMRGDHVRTDRNYSIYLKEFFSDSDSFEKLRGPVTWRGGTLMASERDITCFCQAGFRDPNFDCDYNVNESDPMFKPNLWLNILNCDQEKMYKLVTEPDREKFQGIKRFMFSLNSSCAAYVDVSGLFPMKICSVF